MHWSSSFQGLGYPISNKNSRKKVTKGGPCPTHCHCSDHHWPNRLKRRWPSARDGLGRHYGRISQLFLLIWPIWLSIGGKAIVNRIPHFDRFRASQDHIENCSHQDYYALGNNALVIATALNVLIVWRLSVFVFIVDCLFSSVNNEKSER